MYTPTIRLLAVLELLETYHALSGSELARRLEVDRRTIRRYIVNLQDMGIPVTAERGPHGSYRLARGSRLPPLIFNDSEAAAITLGLTAISQMNFPIDSVAVQGALAKIERLVPENLLDYLNELRELIKIQHYAGNAAVQIRHSDFVFLLSRAIQKQRRVVFEYSSKANEKTTREVDPYGLVLLSGQWYIAGYCHLRKDLRTFRLDRLHSIKRTRQKFSRMKDFDLLNFVLQSKVQAYKKYEVEILLHTNIEQARSLLPSEVQYLELSADGVLYRLSTSNLNWVALGLLSIDVPFTVHKPAELYSVFGRISEKAARVASSKQQPSL